ncbi:MAG TPA: glycosyltransferase [Pyrinomonadaceae bacterium]|jgi:glycosyltransferase involved in cell wall biosynthesis
MTGKPLVSICVLSYNHARYLPETLDSALAQTYPHVEIVVVDDGSTDDSLAIARDYEARYSPRVKVYTHPNHENRGISQTINLATNSSTGAYWSVLGSDDILHKDKIEKQAAFLEAHPELGFVYCYVDYMDFEGKKLPGSFGKDITADEDPLKSMILENFIPAMAILARREAVSRVGDHDPDLIYSDWDFWVRLISLYKGGFINESLSKYRVHSDNSSIGTPRATQVRHIRDLYFKLLRHVDKGLLDESYREIIEGQIKDLPARQARWLLIDYYEFLANGQRKNAFRALKAASWSAPQVVLSPRRFASLLKEAILSLRQRPKIKQN